MNFTEKAKKHIDSCRFCWMCRHICPIGNATGQERNNARARALCLSLVMRGAENPEAVADNVYECALCGACVKECATGWDPVSFTLEARKELAMEGKLPSYIEKLLDNYEKSGSVYAAAEENSALTEAKKRHANKTDTLFLLSHAAIYRDAQDTVKSVGLLEKTGIKFTVAEKEPSSGADLRFLIGDTGETQEAARNCAELLNEYKTVIFLNPDDAKIVVREYKEWGIDVKAKLFTFTSFIADNLDKLKVKRKKLKIAPQDPFALGRELEETEPLRKIAAAAGTLNEMLNKRKDTFMAASAIMAEYMPDVMKTVGERRLRDSAAVGADAMLTCSPSEHAVVKDLAFDGVKAISVAELLLD